MSDLTESMLRRLLSFVPLKDRLAVTTVNKQWHDVIEQSVVTASLYSDPLIDSTDDQLKLFFNKYGAQLKYANFDMFRIDQAVSQWNWRQMVTGLSRFCPNLLSLDVIFCSRHKLRDKDLIDVFSACLSLRELRIDAQFVTGHCFAHVPATLQRLELDKCARITNSSLFCVANRCRSLKTLHLSQFENVSNKAIEEVSKKCLSLEEVSLIGFPTIDDIKISTNGLLHLSQLPKLRTLCLEGLGGVTDRLLLAMAREGSAMMHSLEGISLAFCFNLSSAGVAHLAAFPRLKFLNLDGVRRRELSEGIVTLAAKGRLEKLLLAERTSVSAEALLSAVKTSPKLRLLDVCNNPEATNWATARELVTFWSKKVLVDGTRRPLVVLTDEAITWTQVDAPNCNPYIRPMPVQVVNIDPEPVPHKRKSVFSRDSALQLPSGFMAPELRRGNRYRLMCGVDPNVYLGDQENIDPLAGMSKDMRQMLMGDAWDDGANVAGMFFKNGYFHGSNGQMNYIGDAQEMDELFG
uniref:F-box domain-containing protein n=1 Tax=Plectus sambesii TaxID=2011161 RepID=A0A914XIY1_9BILA